MFELTRREQALLVGLVVVFVLGLGTMHWRSSRPVAVPPPEAAAR